MAEPVPVGSKLPQTGFGARSFSDTSCHVMVKSIDTPWCDDVAAGWKFFECVANRKRFVNQFKRLQARDAISFVRVHEIQRFAERVEEEKRGGGEEDRDRRGLTICLLINWLLVSSCVTGCRLLATWLHTGYPVTDYHPCLESDSDFTC